MLASALQLLPRRGLMLWRVARYFNSLFLLPWRKIKLRKHKTDLLNIRTMAVKNEQEKETQNFTPQTYILFCVFLLHCSNLFSERPVSKWRSYLTVAYFFPTFTIPFVYFSGLLCMETFINPLYKWYDVCQASFRNKCQSFRVPQVLIDLIATRICSPTIIIMKTQLFVYITIAYPNTFTTFKASKLIPIRSKTLVFVRNRFLGLRRIGWKLLGMILWFIYGHTDLRNVW